MSLISWERSNMKLVRLFLESLNAESLVFHKKSWALRMRGDKHSSYPQWIHSLPGERLLRCCTTPSPAVFYANKPLELCTRSAWETGAQVPIPRTVALCFHPCSTTFLPGFLLFFFISSFIHLRLPYVIDPKSLSSAQVSIWSSRHLDFTAQMPPLTGLSNSW